MMDEEVATIELTTYQSCDPVALSSEDVAFLRDHLAQHVMVTRTIDAETYQLNPNQYVGVVMLPSGRRVESRPRVGVGNILFMLTVAYRMQLVFRAELASFAPFEELIDAVATYFADLVAELLARGLYRSYTEREENLSTVRGRIVFAEDVRLNVARRHKTVCRYSELTWDIPENQVLRQVAVLLSNWPFRRPEVRARLTSIAAELGELSPSTLRPEDVDRFNYHRQNEHYRRPHALCRLFLAGMSVGERAGDFAFQTFLLDMNKLFEMFVTQALEDRLRLPFRVDPQRSERLDVRGALAMRPDLVVARGTEDLLVADCKFKRLATGEFKNHDHYQLLAYCTALGVDRGVLIYPLHEVEATQQLTVRNSSVRMATLTIDLDGDVTYLQAACDRLAGAIVTKALEL
jgi:5-methylcytosine-specific restriction enzyme subunit McrC